MSNELIAKLDLYTGRELTQVDMDDLILKKEKEYIMNRALKILRYHDRAVNELRQKLFRLGFEERLATEVVQELVDDNTLDDQRFVREFISDYTKLNPKGNRYIAHELKKRGVAPELIEEAIAARDEKALAREFLDRKFKNLDLNKPKDKQKIYRRMSARGFSPSVIFDLLKGNE